MRLLLDAGAFIALERGDRRLEALLRRERARGRVWMTHGGIVGQVWRGGARQAVIARALSATEIMPLTAGVGRDAGRLLATSGTPDVIDAALVCLAEDGDVIVTSDPHDLRRLMLASGLDLRLVVV